MNNHANGINATNANGAYSIMMKVTPKPHTLNPNTKT